MPREPASVDTDLLHLETQMKGASCVLKTLSGLHVFMDNRTNSKI